MIPQRWIEAYLRFLLRYRGAITVVVALMTVCFAYSLKDIRLHTDFFDFYPRRHPYIQFYNEFRRMFGTANIMNVILEVEEGRHLQPRRRCRSSTASPSSWSNTKGVVPYQILSIAHPAVNSAITAAGGGAGAPASSTRACRKPRTTPNACGSRCTANPNIRGLYVANDDTAAVVNVGFWEEALDFRYLNERMRSCSGPRKTPTTRSTSPASRGSTRPSCSTRTNSSTCSGSPSPRCPSCCTRTSGRGRASGCRSSPGCCPASGAWASPAILGFNLDPLVLVIPIFLTARALSHSVQSMDRYHEEFYRLRDKHQAIVVRTRTCSRRRSPRSSPTASGCSSSPWRRSR